MFGRFFITILLGTSLLASFSWAQFDEDEAPAAADDSVSFDDFEKDGSAAAKSSSENATTKEEGTTKAETPPPVDASEESSSPDDMSLEPLDGDEDQVTEVPEAPAEQPTPKEMTPPPPEMAEPEPEPTPDPFPEPVAQPVDDSPDLDLEARLHDIYVNFHSKKLSPEEWSQLIRDRESETYQIQRGDTLWAISKTFFNDGHYWPKIWQLNSAITNPHLIQPGNTIRFLLGTESETPAFTVTEANQEPVEIPPGEGGAAEVTAPPPVVSEVTKAEPVNKAGSVDGTPTDEVEIPPPSETYTPVLKKIPPSLPEWALQRKGSEYDDVGVDYGRRPILDLQDKKYLEAFVEDQNIRTDGSVREIEGGASTAANFQYVFVSLPPGQGKTGDHFTVVKSMGRLPRVSMEIATVDLGYQYRVQGEVKLTDLLSTTDEEEPRDIFRAIVLKTLAQIEKGSLVMRGVLPTISVDPKGVRNDVLTQIVGAHLLEKQETLALHNLAYLSAGRSVGLEPGQVLTVRANTRVRNAESIIKESYIPVGQLKVLRVAQNFSTAIVTKVWDAIFVGDVTGAGKVLPPEPPERQSANKKKPIARAAPPPSEEMELDNSDIEGEELDDFSDEDLDQ